jgi:hypothetical protein
VQLGDTPGERESHPEAALGARERPVALHEEIEDAR